MLWQEQNANIANRSLGDLELDRLKNTALLGLGVLSAVESFISPPSGMECRLNKVCSPGLPVMGDEPASKDPEPLIANLAIASGGMPTIILTPAPGWTVEKQGFPIVRLLVPSPKTV
jgi:hypothetical protein